MTLRVCTPGHGLHIPRWYTTWYPLSGCMTHSGCTYTPSHVVRDTTGGVLHIVHTQSSMQCIHAMRMVQHMHGLAIHYSRHVICHVMVWGTIYLLDIHDGHIVHGRMWTMWYLNTPSQGTGVHALPAPLWCGV